MSDQITSADTVPQKSGLGALQLLGIVLLTIVLTAGVTYWALMKISENAAINIF